MSREQKKKQIIDELLSRAGFLLRKYGELDSGGWRRFRYFERAHNNGDLSIAQPVGCEYPTIMYYVCDPTTGAWAKNRNSFVYIHMKDESDPHCVCWTRAEAEALPLMRRLMSLGVSKQRVIGAPPGDDWVYWGDPVKACPIPCAT